MTKLSNASFSQRTPFSTATSLVNFSINRTGWARPGLLSKTISVILIITILASIGAIINIVTSAKGTDRFTEFYILGLEGKAGYYPMRVNLGKQVKVLLGIINQEHEEVSYMVTISINGITDNEIGPLTLNHEEKWEQEVSFVPTVVGANQKVDFILYKQGQESPYSTLYLWINVKEP